MEERATSNPGIKRRQLRQAFFTDSLMWGIGQYPCCLLPPPCADRELPSNPPVSTLTISLALFLSISISLAVLKEYGNSPAYGGVVFCGALQRAAVSGGYSGGVVFGALQRAAIVGNQGDAAPCGPYRFSLFSVPDSYEGKRDLICSAWGNKDQKKLTPKNKSSSLSVH